MTGNTYLAAFRYSDEDIWVKNVLDGMKSREKSVWIRTLLEESIQHRLIFSGYSLDSIDPETDDIWELIRLVNIANRIPTTKVENQKHNLPVADEICIKDSSLTDRETQIEFVIDSLTKDDVFLNGYCRADKVLDNDFLKYFFNTEQVDFSTLAVSEILNITDSMVRKYIRLFPHYIKADKPNRNYRLDFKSISRIKILVYCSNVLGMKFESMDFIIKGTDTEIKESLDIDTLDNVMAIVDKKFISNADMLKLYKVLANEIIEERESKETILDMLGSILEAQNKQNTKIENLQKLTEQYKECIMLNNQIAESLHYAATSEKKLNRSKGLSIFNGMLKKR